MVLVEEEGAAAGTGVHGPGIPDAVLPHRTPVPVATGRLTPISSPDSTRLEIHPVPASSIHSSSSNNNTRTCSNSRETIVQ